MKKLIKKLWNLFFHTEKGLYLVFGALTTLVSLVVFYLFNGFDVNVLGSKLFFEGLLPASIALPFSLSVSGYMVATVLRNVAGIIFAYFTNRGMVFGSTAKGKEKIKEFFKFISSRLITFALDLLMMYLMVDVFDMQDTLAGILSMVIVIILNYVLSKLFVFNKNEHNAQKEE